VRRANPGSSVERTRPSPSTGASYRWNAVESYPKPVRAGVPIVVGGHVEARLAAPPASATVLPRQGRLGSAARPAGRDARRNAASSGRKPESIRVHHDRGQSDGRHRQAIRRSRLSAPRDRASRIRPEGLRRGLGSSRSVSSPTLIFSAAPDQPKIPQGSDARPDGIRELGEIDAGNARDRVFFAVGLLVSVRLLGLGPPHASDARAAAGLGLLGSDPLGFCVLMAGILLFRGTAARGRLGSAGSGSGARFRGVRTLHLPRLRPGSDWRGCWWDAIAIGLLVTFVSCALSRRAPGGMLLHHHRRHLDQDPLPSAGGRSNRCATGV